MNSLTYTLNSPTDIGSIVVYGGWQDGGRDQQIYSILYATSAAPGTFLPLTTVDFNPPAPGTFPQATSVTITEGRSRDYPSPSIAAKIAFARNP